MSQQKLLSIFYKNKEELLRENNYIKELKEIFEGLYNLLKVGKGSIELSLLTKNNELISSLSMCIENSNMRLVLFESESEENEEDVIREYWGGDISKAPIIINDEEISSFAVTQDIQFVIELFKEFFETGNVSKDILE